MVGHRTPTVRAALAVAAALGVLIAAAAGGCTPAATGRATPTAGATSSATVAATPRQTAAAVTPAGAEPLLAARATVPPSTRPIVEPTRIEWDASAVVANPDAYYRIPCPAAADPARANPGQVFNIDTPAALTCVLDAMRANGTTEPARTFLQRYGVFLAGFEERGRVDLGSIDAAWLNMGRPEPAFLGSTPAMLPLSLLVTSGGPAGPVRQWLAQPAYTAALRGEADALAWPEYATVVPAPRPAAGAQRFLATMPLRKCRACADLAILAVVLDFGDSGDYLGWELQPPLAAAAPATGTATAAPSATRAP